MAERPATPHPLDQPNSNTNGSIPGSNILIDSGTTPKSMTRRFQTQGSSPLNVRKSTRAPKGKSAPNSENENPESTDDEYFTQPPDPKQHKKTTRNKKKAGNNNGVPGKQTRPGTASIPVSDGAIPSGSNDSIASQGKPSHANEIDTFNIISDFLNSQSDRLERQIEESSKGSGNNGI